MLLIRVTIDTTVTSMAFALSKMFFADEMLSDNVPIFGFGEFI